MGKGKRLRANRKEKKKIFDGLKAGDFIVIPKKSTGQDPIIRQSDGKIITKDGIIDPEKFNKKLDEELEDN